MDLIEAVGSALGLSQALELLKEQELVKVEPSLSDNGGLTYTIDPVARKQIRDCIDAEARMFVIATAWWHRRRYSEASAGSKVCLREAAAQFASHSRHTLDEAWDHLHVSSVALGHICLAPLDALRGSIFWKDEAIDKATRLASDLGDALLRIHSYRMKVMRLRTREVTRRQPLTNPSLCCSPAPDEPALRGVPYCS